MQDDPQPTKVCYDCKEAKPVSDFYKCKSSKDGLQFVCKPCDRQRRSDHHQAHRDAQAATHRKWRAGPGGKKVLLRSAQVRALAKGIPFSLTEKDFEIPEFCPVLDIRLAIGTGRGPAPHSPTLDRIDPQLGYVAGNVQVISSRANAMKNDASADELRRFAAWILKEFPRDRAKGTGWTHTPKTRAEMSADRKGRPKSPETRAKMAEARRAWWERKRGGEAA